VGAHGRQFDDVAVREAVAVDLSPVEQAAAVRVGVALVRTEEPFLVGGETVLVQCKQWKTSKVGVKVVRELYGVVMAEGATKGILIASGTYTQEDIFGRPGVNTVFSGSDMVKNNFNTTTVTGRVSLTPIFENTLEAYHDVYAVALGADPANVNYVPNILGLDAPTFATVLAQFDALQVAPNAQTTYFDPSTGVALTGRTLNDDVIDISLILMFGGGDLSNFNFNGDEPGEPLLISDNVGFGNRQILAFPYMETPNL
jgi:hypothetical protein